MTYYHLRMYRFHRNNDYFYKYVFSMQNEFYPDLPGCIRGAPIESTIAHVVMDFLEKRFIQNLTFFKTYNNYTE